MITYKKDININTQLFLNESKKSFLEFMIYIINVLKINNLTLLDSNKIII